MERLAGKAPRRVHVDKGYKGHGVDSERCQVLISEARKGLSRALRREMKRRSAIEPDIGHMKVDGHLGRNFLNGMIGDAQNALLCGAGHNLRKILARLRALLRLFSGEARAFLEAFLALLDSDPRAQPHLKPA